MRFDVSPVGTGAMTVSVFTPVELYGLGSGEERCRHTATPQRKNSYPKPYVHVRLSYQAAETATARS